MDETMEVTPSEEYGNVPVDSPSEEIQSVEPTEETVSDEPSESEEELYDLPDGRKVDAETLSREWKENFYPEYTRKSQELAKAKNENLPINNETPYADPEWQPETYAELIEITKQELRADMERERLAEIQHREAIENTVVSQLDQVKSMDPNVNENALFIHATKYKFNDLTLAYQNMKDMNRMVKDVQQTTVNNIAKRNDPVSIPSGSSSQPLNPSHYATAVDYLKALKGMR